MENENLTNHRLKALENLTKSHMQQLNDLDDELKNINQRENDRYTETSNLSIKLDESYKNQRETVNRLVKSIDGLVSEMKETNKTYSDQFSKVDKRFNNIENELKNLGQVKQNQIGATVAGGSVDGNTKDLGNTSKGAIVLGIFGIIEVFVRYVAPLLFS